MRVLTFKARPKTIFGLILLLTGFIVILITFLGNHSAETTMAGVSCSTTEERLGFITSCGYETDGKESSKEISIPSVFNDVYNQYNDVQKEQGFNLQDYMGCTATLYTYNITNYKDNENVIADLIVIDGKLVGADLCDVSADSGFLVALKSKE